MKKLSQIEKMEQWHNGTRKQNVKACSDEKLEIYYNICLEKGYVMEANVLYQEIVGRGIQDEVPEMRFEKVDGKLNADEICKYIENHLNDIGDDGGDLFKLEKDGCIYYSWGYRTTDPFIMSDYDCMVDKNKNIISFYPDEEDISLDDTLTVINAIQDEVFTC